MRVHVKCEMHRAYTYNTRCTHKKACASTQIYTRNSFERRPTGIIITSIAPAAAIPIM